MKTLRIFLAIAFIGTAPLPADAFRLKTEPSVIMPGDAFVLRITGVKESVQPEAKFRGRQLPIESCGEGCLFAIGAVDTKTRPGRYTVRFIHGRRSHIAAVQVVPHAFPVIRVALPPDKVTLSKEDEARAEREAELMKSFWQLESEKAWNGGFVFPLANEISTRYGVKRVINEKKESIHGGIDIRGREGEEVRAANSGRVIHADELFFGGNTLIVDHGMGIYTVYMHLSGFGKTSGDRVSKGEIIGFVGSTGRSSGPHLHFGVKVRDLSVNPVSFMKLNL